MRDLLPSWGCLYQGWLEELLGSSSCNGQSASRALSTAWPLSNPSPLLLLCPVVCSFWGFLNVYMQFVGFY